MLKPDEKNWQPFTLDELGQAFSRADFDWCIAGGWAIDLFLGIVTREHSDIDVLIQRQDQLHLQNMLNGWDIWVSDPPGTLRPWKQGEYIAKGLQDIWCRQNPEGPWRFQVMLFDVEEENWIFKRDESIRRSLASVLMGSKLGFTILSPDVQLLYKSKSMREKDQHDFNVAILEMSLEQKTWLKNMLIKVYNQHPWIEKL